MVSTGRSRKRAISRGNWGWCGARSAWGREAGGVWGRRRGWRRRRGEFHAAGGRSISHRAVGDRSCTFKLEAMYANGLVAGARRVACNNLPQSRQNDGTIRGLRPPAQQSQATHRTRILSRCGRDPELRHKHRRPKLRRSMWHGWKASVIWFATSTGVTRRWLFQRSLLPHSGHFLSLEVSSPFESVAANRYLQCGHCPRLLRLLTTCLCNTFSHDRSENNKTKNMTMDSIRMR